MAKRISSLRTRPGFTIVELLLSMAFISGLLVLIAILTMRVTTMYQRGLTLKSVNSVGRQLIEEISYAVRSAPAKPAEMICREFYHDNKGAYEDCVKDGAFKLNFYQAYGKVVKIDGKNAQGENTVPLYGTLCTGRYSYLWNSGYALNVAKKYELENKDFKPAKISIQDSGGNNDYSGGRLLRILDSKRELCKANLSSGGYTYESSASTEKNYEFKAAAAGDIKPPIDLIRETDESLAVYDLRLFRPAIHRLTRQSYYSGTFILATMRGGVDITGVGDYCVNPSEAFATDFSYCAINKFNFAVRAVGELTIDEQAERNLRYETQK